MNFEFTKNIQEYQSFARCISTYSRVPVRSDGNELSRRELERQIQELRRDKAHSAPSFCQDIWGASPGHGPSSCFHLFSEPMAGVAKKNCQSVVCNPWIQKVPKFSKKLIWVKHQGGHVLWQGGCGSQPLPASALHSKWGSVVWSFGISWQS